MKKISFAERFAIPSMESIEFLRMENLYMHRKMAELELKLLLSNARYENANASAQSLMNELADFRHANTINIKVDL